MARQWVNSGTKDKCRTCGQLIEWHQFQEMTKRYRSDEQYLRTWWAWAHDLGRDAEPRWAAEAGPETERHRAQPVSFCIESPQMSYYGSSSYCHRPVKDAELFMCGIHARPVREQQRKEERRAKDESLRAYHIAEVKKLCDRLEELGVKEPKVHFKVHSTNSYPYNRTEVTGNIVVDPEQLLELLTEEKF